MNDRQRIFVLGFCVNAADVTEAQAAEATAAYAVLTGLFPGLGAFLKLTETPEGAPPAVTLADVTTA